MSGFTSGLSFNVCTPTPISGCISVTPSGSYGSVCLNTGIVSICNITSIPAYTQTMVNQGVKDFSYMSNHMIR